MWTAPSWERTFRAWRERYPNPEWCKGLPNDREKEWFVRFVRSSVAPGALIAEIRRFMATDIRPALPTVSVPTLVIADPEGRDDLDPRNSRIVADRIAGSRLVEMELTEPPNWPHWYGPAHGIVREVASFLASVRDEERSFDRALATVMFTDIVGSTERAAELGDRRWHELLERHHAAARAMLARYRGHEVNTTGDGFFATFDGPARAIRCAVALAEAVRALGIEIRAGLHTGEVELAGEDVRGVAVHIGARVGALAGPSEVLVSSTVKDLVAGSGLVFQDAGEHELKGVPDRWRLYRVLA
jgi:class 3 adenylate cyclase